MNERIAEFLQRKSIPNWEIILFVVFIFLIEIIMFKANQWLIKDDT